MKKVLLLTALISLTTHALFAQNPTIQNGGFESWTGLEPDNWITLNSLAVLFATQAAYQATAAGEFHDGSSAVKLVTMTHPNPIVGALPSTLTNGVSSNAGAGINTRPESLGGWVRFDPNGVDTGTVDITLRRWDDVNKVRVTVGTAKKKFGNTNGVFENFVLPIEYQSSEKPDTAVIVFASGYAGLAKSNTAMFIDDLYYVCKTYDLNESVDVCSGDDYTFPDGSTQSNITEQVVYTSYLQTTELCDSNITTTVNVKPVYEFDESVTVSLGEDYTFPDGSTESNITAQVVYISNIQTNSTCINITTTVDVEPNSVQTPEDIALTVYPNPTQDVLRILSSTSNVFRTASVYGLDGKLVQHVTLNSQSIDVSGLSTGTYVLGLRTDEGVVVRRTFIKTE
ncbi:T9SS type A sorting domain-containing protein [Bacteroidota bacterium]